MTTATKNGRLPEVKPENTSIVIERIAPQIIEIPIVGITPLMVCNWSDKARRQMLEKQMQVAKTATTGKATRGREAKDPQADYQASLYKSAEGDWTGIPASGVKAALVNACRAVDNLPMTLAKRMIFVREQGRTAKGQGLVRIYGKHEMNESMVRIDSGGTTDIRFRAIRRGKQLSKSSSSAISSVPNRSQTLLNWRGISKDFANGDRGRRRATAAIMADSKS